MLQHSFLELIVVDTYMYSNFIKQQRAQTLVC